MTETLIQFQLFDIPRILPEILLSVLAVLVLGSDVFERWGSDETAQQERSRSSASLAILGLGMIFVIVLLQSGYIYALPADAPENILTNILRNLQSVRAADEPVLGAFATDNLSMLSRLIFVGAALLTCLLTLDFRPHGNPGEFYTLIIVSTLGMCCMAAASEMVLAIVALELTSVPLYILAGYFVPDRSASEAGMKYFLFGSLSAGILLYGMSLVYGYAATNAIGATSANDLTQFARIGEIAGAGTESSSLLVVGVLFIIAGLGYKLAVVPFHSWSPDVYQAAPTPITAFISTASKAAGFVLLYRLLISALPGLGGMPAGFALAEGVTFGGWTGMLAVVALLTLVAGNLMALPQTNAKRLLAYSSIAHAGFIILALLAWASPLNMDHLLGFSSLMYYLVVYTLTNIGAFGALAVVAMAVGGDDLRDLNGLAQRNLGLAVLFTIFIFSLAGIPPIAGFFAKFYVFMAGWQSGAHWLVIIAVITTLIALYYYLRFIKAIFITPPASREPIAAPLGSTIALVIAAVLVVALGIYPNMLLWLFEGAGTIAGR
jgi:NADH-quinone oxidoreductase subunit N